MTAVETFRSEFLTEYELPDAGARRIFEIACATLGEIERMERRIADDGETVKGSRGQPAPHPLLAAVRSHRDAFVRLVKELEGPAESASAAGRALAGKRWG